MQIILAFAAVYIIWGSTYLAIRFGLETLPPFLLAGVRFLTAGAILFAWQYARNPQKTTFPQWRAAAIIGIALVTIGNGAVVWAELRISSGVAAIVVAVMPCWMVLLDWLWARNARPTAAVAAGLMLGFGGLALLILPGMRGSAGSVDIAGVIAIMCASICWAAGSIYSRRAPLPKPQLFATGMEMLCGGALLVALSFSVGEPQSLVLHEVSMRSALALLYLMVFGSLIAFSAYIWLLQQVSAAQVSTYAYVNPLVAVLLGWAFGGEALTATMGAAAAAIILGVIVITVAGRKASDH